MENDYVEGLTGEEIINDLLEQIAAKLRGDCNLREMDAYTGGYEGTAKIHLKLHGLDTAEVKLDIPLGTPDDAEYPEVGELPIETEVDAEIDVKLEPRLNLVRERSGQDVPTLSKDEDGAPIVKKRHYAKRQK